MADRRHREHRRGSRSSASLTASPPGAARRDAPPVDPADRWAYLGTPDSRDPLQDDAFEQPIADLLPRDVPSWLANTDPATVHDTLVAALRRLIAERQRRPHPVLEPDLDLWCSWLQRDVLHRPREGRELVPLRGAVRPLYRLDSPYGHSERQSLRPEIAYLLTLDDGAPPAAEAAARERAVLWRDHGSSAFRRLGFYPALTQAGGPDAAARVAGALGDDPGLAVPRMEGDALEAVAGPTPAAAGTRLRAVARLDEIVTAEARAKEDAAREREERENAQLLQRYPGSARFKEWQRRRRQ